jgi:HPt (histidine-containing phosphotransfer) domain-containing protein
LRQFVVGHSADVGEARRLYFASERKDAAHLVHGLHGMSSLLQAKDVARLTAALAKTLRGDSAEAVPPLFDAIEIAMHAIAESIDRLDAIGAAAVS